MRDHIAPKSTDLRSPRQCTHIQTVGHCGKEVPEDAPVALCLGHIATAWEYCQTLITRQRTATAELDAAARRERAQELFFKGLEQKHEAQRAIAADTTVDDPESVVYYIRFGDRIKIGFSRNLGERLANLPYDELLVVEPGARLVEDRRHKQFAEDRIRGEWFAQSPALLAHIEDLKAKQRQRLICNDAFIAARKLDDPFYMRTDESILDTLT